MIFALLLPPKPLSLSLHLYIILTAVRLSFRKIDISNYNSYEMHSLKGVRDLKFDSKRPTPFAQAQIVRKETGRESREHRLRPSHGLFA